MTPVRDHRGRFQSLAHDPGNPWVLIDDTVREAELRTRTRAECRSWQRIGGGRIVDTRPKRRKQK